MEQRVMNKRYMRWISSSLDFYLRWKSVSPFHWNDFVIKWSRVVNYKSREVEILFSIIFQNIRCHLTTWPLQSNRSSPTLESPNKKPKQRMAFRWLFCFVQRSLWIIELKINWLFSGADVSTSLSESLSRVLSRKITSELLCKNDSINIYLVHFPWIIFKKYSLK